MAGTTSGHLLIADISGYTRYLTSSELEHAQGVLGSLMELLIDQTVPPLRVSGLQGDAVFSYAIAGEALRGQTLVEIIEDTYVAFRRAIEQMVINTTCECNACANISALDLKLFVHHGTFSISQLRGKEELVGPTVIEIHRLLKNSIAEVTGIRAYTAYTTQAVAALDLDGFSASLAEHTERYDDIGELTVWVQDMHPVWEHKRNAPIVDLPEDDVLVAVHTELPVPPVVAWDLLIQPKYRATLLGVRRQEVEGTRDGRIGDGSVFRCYHGANLVTTQTVVGWKPFDYIITEDTTPLPGARVLFKIALQPSDRGTAVSVSCSAARGRWLSRTASDIVGRRLLRSALTKGLTTLRNTIERELAEGTIQIPSRTDPTDTDVETAVAESLRTNG